MSLVPRRSLLLTMYTLISPKINTLRRKYQGHGCTSRLKQRKPLLTSHRTSTTGKFLKVLSTALDRFCSPTEMYSRATSRTMSDTVVASANSPMDVFLRESGETTASTAVSYTAQEARSSRPGSRTGKSPTDSSKSFSRTETTTKALSKTTADRAKVRCTTRTVTCSKESSRRTSA